MALNDILARIFKYRLVSARALPEPASNRQLDNKLRRLEMASTPILFDRPDLKRGALSFETKFPIFNPSIVSFGDGFVCISRSTNLTTRLDFDYYPLSFPHSSINVIHRLDSDLNPLSQFVLDDEILRKQCAAAIYGIEDVRLFVWKEAVWGIGAGISPDPADKTSDDFVVTQIMFRIGDGKIAEFHELASPCGARKEKNWTPLVLGDELFFIYGITPYSVFRFDAGRLTLARGVSPKDNLCSIRGSTPFVPWKGKFIAIAHPDRKQVDRKYYRRHVFVVIDRHMNLEQISEPFFLQRKGMEFACGLSQHDSGLVVAFGVMDQTSEFCIFPFEALPRWVAY